MVRSFKARLSLAWLLASISAPVLCQPMPADTPADTPTDTPTDTNQIKAAADKLNQPHGSHLEPILVKIHANPEQRTKITIIVTNYRPKIEPLRQEYRQKSQEFLDYIITGQPAEKVISRQSELNHLYGAIVTQYSMMRLEIRKVLSPEQSKLYDDYRRQQGWTKR